MFLIYHDKVFAYNNVIHKIFIVKKRALFVLICILFSYYVSAADTDSRGEERVEQDYYQNIKNIFDEHLEDVLIESPKILNRLVKICLFDNWDNYIKENDSQAAKVTRALNDTLKNLTYLTVKLESSYCFWPICVDYLSHAQKVELSNLIKKEVNYCFINSRYSGTN